MNREVVVGPVQGKMGEECGGLKGTDRLCKVVKLSMQCCGQILEDSFEPYKTFLRSVSPEFERKVDVQNRSFGWMFQN